MEHIKNSKSKEQLEQVLEHPEILEDAEVKSAYDKKWKSLKK
jgi:hypothetical protein